MRKFETGASRDTDAGKPHYSGYLSPLVLQAFGEYMLRHERQADGTVRKAGNWKAGIPKDAYMDSLSRHVMDVWLHHDGAGEGARESLREALCGVMFNAMGYLYEDIKGR